jgi:hypothetical protein
MLKSLLPWKKFKEVNLEVKDDCLSWLLLKDVKTGEMKNLFVKHFHARAIHHEILKTNILYTDLNGINHTKTIEGLGPETYPFEECSYNIYLPLATRENRYAHFSKLDSNYGIEGDFTLEIFVCDYILLHNKVHNNPDGLQDLIALAKKIIDNAMEADEFHFRILPTESKLPKIPNVSKKLQEYNSDGYIIDKKTNCKKIYTEYLKYLGVEFSITQHMYPNVLEETSEYYDKLESNK